jgi:anaerobic magnesium-protoporphyrin IX monomethyl ester cyclase
LRVLFLYSVGHVASQDRPLETMGQIQFGIAYVSALLKQHGHQTELLVVSHFGDKDNSSIVHRKVEEFRPDMIGFYAVATEFAYVESMARLIRSIAPKSYLLVGGPHATLRPDEAIAGPFDAVCIGEGELPALELASQLARGQTPSNIQNLWLRRGSEVQKNPTRPFLQDLNGLPLPDRAPWLQFVQHPVSRPSLLLGRGCPFQCTYCSNHALKKLASGRYVRMRSADSIIAEIVDLRNWYRFPEPPEIYLEVETFALDMDWTLDLCHRLHEQNGHLAEPLRYGVNLRVFHNLQTERLMAAMAEANFTFVNVGLEAGSERVRREVLHRDYSNEDIIRTVMAARRHGLRVNLFNMIGLPGETCAEHLETVRMNRLCQPDLHHTGIFFPYPGTDLYHRCKEMGLPVDSLDTSKERRQAVLTYEGFSAREIRHAMTWFNYRVYRGHKPLTELLWPPLVEYFPWLNKPLSVLAKLKHLFTG